MLQQHYHYMQQERKKTKTGHDIKVKAGKQPLDNARMLGHTDKNISSWHYDSKSKFCIFYDKNGKEFNRINLDTIIRNYIGPFPKENVIESRKDNVEKERKEISEKEFELLKMLHARDVDVETATDILNVTKNQLNLMVHRLLTLEMLHYISFDEVALTDTGINHLDKKMKNN